MFAVFGVCVAFIFLWNKRFPKIPGAVIAAFAGIICILIFEAAGIEHSMVTLGDKYPDLKGTLFTNITPHISLDMFLNREIWLISMATAIIAILETLLSGQIADQMTKTKFNRQKEVFGLAVANIASGVMGGIPATAALARTSLNVKSGAGHKTSGIINAIFVGIISLFLLNYFKAIPIAVIAAILVIVAIGMVERKHFIHLIENERTAFLLSMLVAIVVVVEDPIFGILAGTFIALLIFVNRVSYGQTEILIWKDGKMIEAVLKNEFIKKEPYESDIIVYKISGTLMKRTAFKDNKKKVTIYDQLEEENIDYSHAVDSFNNIISNLLS